MDDELPVNCKSCRAPIKWVRMASGKMMPVDLPGENRVVIMAERGRIERAYVSHFQTCPYADQHRRKAG